MDTPESPDTPQTIAAYVAAEKADEAGESRLAVLAAILLGLAATLTALAAYQASLQDGEVLTGYNASSTALTDANYFYATGNQTFAQDQALFVEFATAANADQQDTAAYLQTLMRPELVEALDWWQADADAVTPFDDDAENPYVIAEFAEAERLADESKAAYDEATAAGDVGDTFELATVLLALTLFFAGIATLFRRRLVSTALLGIALVSLVAGSLQLGVALGA